MKHEAFTEIVSGAIEKGLHGTASVLLGEFGTKQVAILQGEHNTLLLASNDLEDLGYYQVPCNLTPYDHTGVVIAATTFDGPMEIDMYPSRNNDSRVGRVKYPGTESGVDEDQIVLGVFKQVNKDSGFRRIPLATSHERAQEEGQGWSVLHEQQDLALHPDFSATAITELEKHLKSAAATALRENVRVGIYGVHNYPLSPEDLQYLPAACELATIVSRAFELAGAFTISFNRVPPGAALGLHSDSAAQTVVTLAGEAEFYVQDRVTDDVHQLRLQPNSVVHLESGTAHAVENIRDVDRWSLVVSH